MTKDKRAKISEAKGTDFWSDKAGRIVSSKKNKIRAQKIKNLRWILSKMTSLLYSEVLCSTDRVILWVRLIKSNKITMKMKTTNLKENKCKKNSTNLLVNLTSNIVRCRLSILKK